jgi:hypothetical protein
MDCLSRWASDSLKNAACWPTILNMTLQLELSPEQESWLKQAAARDGVDQRAALLAMIDSQRAAENPLAGLANDENQLRREISRSRPAEVCARHRQLSEKCQDESLTGDEHRELIELIDLVEAHHAARLARAV